MTSLPPTQDQIVHRPVAALTPHPQRSLFPDIDDIALEQLIADISVREILDPLIITDKGVILSGHQRHRAALALNLETVPVIVKAGLSEAEELRYLIQDNLRSRRLTPSQLAVIGTSPSLAPVVDTIAKDAEARRAQGGVLAGRGRPQQLEAAPPQAKERKGRRRAKQARDIVADIVGVRGRLISDARFCWINAESEVKDIASGESSTTITALAGRIRRAQALAQVKAVASDITDLLLTPDVTATGEYAAKFYGIARSGKGLVAAWLVMLGEGLGFALLSQKLPDERHPESNRLGRLTPLGATVTAISASSETKVDVRPFLGHTYRLTIVVKGKTVKIVKIACDDVNASEQVAEERPTPALTPQPDATTKRARVGRPVSKTAARTSGRRRKASGATPAHSESDNGASPAPAVEPEAHPDSGPKEKKLWA